MALRCLTFPLSRPLPLYSRLPQVSRDILPQNTGTEIKMKEGGFKSRQQSDWENIIFRDWMLPSLLPCAAVSIVVLASSPHNASPLSADRRDDLVDREAGRGQSSEAHRTTQAPGWASKFKYKYK